MRFQERIGPFKISPLPTHIKAIVRNEIYKIVSNFKETGIEEF